MDRNRCSVWTGFTKKHGILVQNVCPSGAAETCLTRYTRESILNWSSIPVPWREMSFFNSKLRYALCAAVDLAMQPSTSACQSREIAARQHIPGPYLDQILASLKGAGLVRRVRGAGGGYNLARNTSGIPVGAVVR